MARLKIRLFRRRGSRRLVFIVTAAAAIIFVLGHEAPAPQPGEDLAAVAETLHIDAAAPAPLPIRTKAAQCATHGPYPDRACTPGLARTGIERSDICRSGYTKTARNVPVSLKKSVYAEYGLSYPQAPNAYEVDHLVPIELGGSNDIANLFPEAAAPAPGFHEKDLVEDYLGQEMCAGRVDLTVAQSLIATDWVRVYESIGADELAALEKKYKSWAK
ncbi:MAG: HNH endonuclease [Patescibacteria group bacterium]|nr:HNH endonuclease [Patescibacteria group bacterium]MDE2116793.1 HNH endonuclease [Patescibacteria group bacterium]